MSAIELVVRKNVTSIQSRKFGFFVLIGLSIIAVTITLTISLFNITGWILLIVPVLAVALIVVIKWPDLMLVFAFAFVPFYELILAYVRTYNWFPYRLLTGWPEAVILTLLALSVLISLTNKQNTISSHQVVLLLFLLIYVLYATMRVLLSDNLGGSVLGFHWSYLWVLCALALWIRLPSLQTIRRLFWIMLAALIISALIGLFQYLVLGQVWTARFYANLGIHLAGVSVGGTPVLRNPSTMGGPWRSGPAYYTLVVFSLAYLVTYYRLKKSAWLFGLVVGIGVLAVMLSLSRAAMVTVSIGICVVLIPLLKRAFPYLVALSLFMGVVFILAFNLNEGVRYMYYASFDRSSLGNENRIIRYIDNTLFSISNHPFGAGIGTSGFFKGSETAQEFGSDTDSSSGENDNFYIKVLWELGIPGLIVLLGICALSLFAYTRMYNATRDPWIKAYTLGAFASLFGYMVMMNTSNLLDWNPIKTYFWTIVGFIPALELHIFPIEAIKGHDKGKKQQ